MTVKQKQRVYFLTVIVLLIGGVALILWRHDVSTSIGTSLFASGIVGLLDWFYRHITTIDATTAEEILSTGIRSISSHRDLDRYHVLMRSLSSRLDITGYSLRSFAESFGDLLIERLRLNSHLKARLLLVDPKSVHSQLRESIEKVHAPNTFQKSVDAIVGKFGKISGVEIRLLDGDLTTMIFRLENTMFVGPQFMSRASRSTATFELQKADGTWLFEQFEKEFEAMWNVAVAV